MLLSCSRCVTTRGAADASPCGEAVKIGLRTLKGLSNRSIQSLLNYVEEILFNEVAKPQIDQEKVIKTHSMIVSHFATTLKATNKALSHAQGRVKAVESELKGSAKVCLCSLALLSTDCWSFTSASPYSIIPQFPDTGGCYLSISSRLLFALTYLLLHHHLANTRFLLQVVQAP